MVTAAMKLKDARSLKEKKWHDFEANHRDVILGPMSILFLFPEKIPTLLPSWLIQKFNKNVEH